MTLLLELALAASLVPKPAAPKPKPLEVRSVQAHSFYDRYAKIELVPSVGLTLADNVQTCRKLARPGGHEDGLPTQSCAGVTLILAGEIATQEFLAYALHRSGHHKAERLVRLYKIEDSIRSITYSSTH